MSALTLTSSEHVIASVPYLLGFEPQESHVIVWLDANGNLGLTQRTDLSDANDPRLVIPGVQNGFAAAVCITFSDSRPEDLSDLNFMISEALEDSGIEVKEVMHYSKGRYWTYLQPKDEMVNDPGTEIDEDTILVVRSRFAMEGMGTVESRHALIEQVTPSDAMLHRYGAARRYWKVKRDEMDLVSYRYEAIDTAHDLALATTWREWDYMLVAASLEDVQVRDALIWHMAHMDRSQLTDIYQIAAQVCRATPRKVAAPILTLSAVCAYMSGNGAAANVCLDLALDCDPDYSMAQMVTLMLSKGIHPSELASIVSSMDLDEILERE